MLKKIKIFIFAGFLILNLFFCSIFTNTAYADNKVYLGGMTAGFSLNTKGAEIVGLCDVITSDGLKTPSKDADLKIGDIILSIDRNDVNCAKDIELNIKNKNSVNLKIKRKEIQLDKSVKIAVDMAGNHKLGVFIREDISGIGTITYIKGNRFASLGHPVVNESGDLLEILGGKIYDCNLTGCIKGERGKAGELRGVFLKNNPVGTIEKNLNCGVFGTTNNKFDYKDLIEIEVGEAVPGNAKIYTTVECGKPFEYDISIIKIDTINNNKNFVIKIDDEELIKLTGGIVQGMSGSPIVQNDKLVGAVTHVFINDPTRGFGISISNMINN